jgi:peptidoglycan hydrolase-like protein with peptidoglycan-binding domain
MAKAQYPLDGRLGKDWKITSEMGWRIHPVQKTKKHHNGADIIGLGKGPHYIEAPYAGKVLKATKSTAPGGGFGNYVILAHKINGKNYTTLYAHLKDGSIKVKKGQKVEAGTVLGIMGTTGMSTGVHLHWEMWAGKTHGWSADGSGFVNAVKFFKALIAQEKELAAAPAATPDDDNVADAPEHTEEQAAKVEAAYKAKKETSTEPKPAPVAKMANPGYPGQYIKKGSVGDSVKFIQQQLNLKVDGVFGDKTHAAVEVLQGKHGLLVDGIVGPKTWAFLD